MVFRVFVQGEAGYARGILYDRWLTVSLPQDNIRPIVPFNCGLGVP